MAQKASPTIECSCGCEHEHIHEHEHGHGHDHAHEHEHEHDHEHAHAHEHGIDISCGCGHEHEHEHGEAEGGGGVIIIGAALLAAALLLEYTARLNFLTWGLLAAAYLLLGWRVLLTAGRNLLHGEVFDENFLMSIATLGAFAIGEYTEAVGVMLFYRIGEYFEDRAVEKSRGQIMQAVDMRPETVNKLAGGEVQVIDAAAAQIGDILLVRPGDRIPLDGVVTAGESRLDTSPITGEPVPVAVSVGSSVTSGCVNTSGQLEIRVEKALSESMVTRILNSVENAAANKPQIDKFITRFARIYTPLVVLAAALVAILPPLLLQASWAYWIKTALTFLVISCPCALVLSVPLAYFAGIGAASKRGILFKGGLAMEALAKVRAVVMDKTGTLTQGNFAVQSVQTHGDMSEDELLALAAGCEASSTHPIAASITAAAAARGLAVTRPERLEELAGMGIKAATAAGEVLCGNRKLLESMGVSLAGYQAAAGGAEVLLAVDGRFAGQIVISDTLKPGAADAVQRLKAKKIVTAMLTGDAEGSARQIAEMTGIDEVHARLLPQDKLARLEDIRARHGSVMFVGDGINDAPVLAGADVGAAMGSGADAAIEAADVVFMTSDMAAVPQAMDIAAETCRIAGQNVCFALLVKAIIMVLGVIGYANMWLAVFADTGVAMLCLLNSIRILYRK